MIYKVIRNELYTGTPINQKMKSCGVSSGKRGMYDPIIVGETHETIVTKEEFTLAQNCIRSGEKFESQTKRLSPQGTFALWQLQTGNVPM